MINFPELKAHASAFVNDVTRLIRKEGELVKAEVSEKVSDLQNGLVAILIAALTAFVAIIFLGHGVALWLATEMGAPTAYAIVGIVLLLLAAIAGAYAKSATSAQNLNPKKTIDTLERAAARVKGE